MTVQTAPPPRRQSFYSLVVACASVALATSAEGQSPYATELISENGAFGGASLYNDPNSVLGEPTRIAVNNDPIIGTSPYHIKIVEPAYNRDLAGNKVITTLGRKPDGAGGFTYGSITVKFDHPIADDPVNPYGIDLNVFGNAFYVGSGYVNDSSDMRSYSLVGGIFAEPVLISVSPDNVNWYTYADGPYGDTAFPTQGYAWNAEQQDLTGNGWTGEATDFTKPVNPTLDSILGAAGQYMPAVDAIAAYVGSGGGTGIDLAESGFASIQYVRVESTADFREGEIDGFADVRPMRVGDALSITPANVMDGTRLLFQNATDVAQSAVIAAFTAVSDLAKLSTSTVIDEAALTALVSGTLLSTYQLDVSALIGGSEVTFTADYQLRPGLGYEGDGSDLSVLGWDGSLWAPISFDFDDVTGMALLADWSQATATLAIVQTAEGTPGDYDGDGRVDGGDFLVWQRHVGSAIRLPNEVASPNVVDGDDLAIWKEYFGQPAIQAQSIPEPPSTVICGVAIIVICSLRRV